MNTPLQQDTLRFVEKPALFDYANREEDRQRVLAMDPILPSGQVIGLVSVVRSANPRTPFAMRLHGAFENDSAAKEHLARLEEEWRQRGLFSPPLVYKVAMGKWLSWPPPLNSEKSSEQQQHELDQFMARYHTDQQRALAELIDRAEDRAPTGTATVEGLLQPHEEAMLAAAVKQ